MLRKINYSVIVHNNCRNVTETTQHLDVGPGLLMSLQAAHPTPNLKLMCARLGRSSLDLFSRKTNLYLGGQGEKELDEGN